jgi:hypothetical protein
MSALPGSYMCWPSPAQETLLRACFLTRDAAQQAFATWRTQIHTANIDDFSQRLLPLLVHRMNPPDEEIAELGARVRLAQWEQNRRRMGVAAALQTTLAASEVECVFLKGIALLSRFYGDLGLRGMGDVDLLVRRRDVVAAARALLRDGWNAEDDLTPEDIGTQARVRHAWQFSRADGEICDLHWHPVVRCFNPEVADAFWNGAECIPAANQVVRVPCATDQLFHVCAHGMQWSWTPQTRWIPDAITILLSSGAPASANAIDWPRLSQLAVASHMTVRLHAALNYLHQQLQAPIPQDILLQLARHPVPHWGRREHELLQKPAPLRVFDSMRWHITNFRRIRPFDEVWGKQLFWLAFSYYLRLFLRPGTSGTLVSSLANKFRKKATSP